MAATRSQQQSLQQKQAGVRKGMIQAILIVAGTFALAIKFPPSPSWLPSSRVEAVLSCLQWSLLPAICLGLCIASIASYRFWSPEDIDGSGLTKGSSEINVLRAILQNTLEQVVLAVVTYLSFAASAPLTWQAAIPAGACIFSVGRLLFARGYSQGAAPRSMGFAMTFYSSMILLLLTTLHSVVGLVGKVGGN